MYKILKLLKRNQGFTLIEMLIVLLIISILLLLIIPNLTNNVKNVKDTGCKGYIEMVQSQVVAFQLNENKLPTFEELVNQNYLRGNVDTASLCPNGKRLIIDNEGHVSVE